MNLHRLRWIQLTGQNVTVRRFQWPCDSLGDLLNSPNQLGWRMMNLNRRSVTESNRTISIRLQWITSESLQSFCLHIQRHLSATHSLDPPHKAITAKLISIQIAFQSFTLINVWESLTLPFEWQMRFWSSNTELIQALKGVRQNL